MNNMRRLIVLSFLFITLEMQCKGEDSISPMVVEMLTDYKENAQVEELFGESDTIYCNILLILSDRGDTLCLVKMSTIEFYYNMFGFLPLPPGNEGMKSNMDTLHYYGSVIVDGSLIDKDTSLQVGDELKTSSQDWLRDRSSSQYSLQGKYYRIFYYYYEPLKGLDAQLLYGTNIIFKYEDELKVRNYRSWSHKIDYFPDMVYEYRSRIIRRSNKKFKFSIGLHRLLEL